MRHVDEPLRSRLYAARREYRLMSYHRALYGWAGCRLLGLRNAWNRLFISSPYWRDADWNLNR
jgi:hypothetical protein